MIEVLTTVREVSWIMGRLVEVHGRTTLDYRQEYEIYEDPSICGVNAGNRSHVLHEGMPDHAEHAR